jgi:DNA-binding FrmR family transcriptional regulator
MDERTKIVIAQRLASASGHLNGVERMTREDAYCIDVIRQIQAVQAALNKVSVLLLETHLDTCILAAVQGEDIAERERMLGEVASIFEV